MAKRKQHTCGLADGLVRYQRSVYLRLHVYTANQVRRAVTDEIMSAIGQLSGQQRANAYADLPD